MLFRSFIAIRAALSLIAPGDGAASAFGNASRRRTMSFHAASTRVALPTSSVLADLDRGVRHIEAHIAGIASASFRVSLLEVLFALLFLKRSDAKAAAAPDDERAELPAFFARTIVFERLVTLLQDALGAVETQGVEARVKRLSGLLSEVQWRYKIISGDSVRKGNRLPLFNAFIGFAAPPRLPGAPYFVAEGAPDAVPPRRRLCPVLRDH